MAAGRDSAGRNSMKKIGLEPKLKETGIRPIVIEEIRNFARKNGIKKVVLFRFPGQRRLLESQ